MWSAESQQRFFRNMLPPFSGSMNKLNKHGGISIFQATQLFSLCRITKTYNDVLGDNIGVS
jgi:hypothetical protein